MIALTEIFLPGHPLAMSPLGSLDDDPDHASVALRRQFKPQMDWLHRTKSLCIREFVDDGERFGIRLRFVSKEQAALFRIFMDSPEP